MQHDQNRWKRLRRPIIMRVRHSPNPKEFRKSAKQEQKINNNGRYHDVTHSFVGRDFCEKSGYNNRWRGIIGVACLADLPRTPDDDDGHTHEANTTRVFFGLWTVVANTGRKNICEIRTYASNRLKPLSSIFFTLMNIKILLPHCKYQIKKNVKYIENGTTQGMCAINPMTFYPRHSYAQYIYILTCQWRRVS